MGAPIGGNEGLNLGAAARYHLGELRNRQDGRDYLEWEIRLGLGPQATAGGQKRCAQKAAGYCQHPTKLARAMERGG